MKHEPVTITKVTFGFSEDRVSNQKTFNNLREADIHLIGRNSQARHEDLMGYWKTDFVLHFSNGETYKGRYDIGCDAPTLTDHVTKYLRSVTEREHAARFDRPKYPYRDTGEAEGVLNIILAEVA